MGNGQKYTQNTNNNTISMLIQRYNAVAVLSTFAHTPPRTKCSLSSIVLVFSLVFSPRIYTTEGN